MPPAAFAQVNALMYWDQRVFSSPTLEDGYAENSGAFRRESPRMDSESWLVRVVLFFAGSEAVS